MVRPFRAQKIILTFYPRALPWAGMDRPVGALGQFLLAKTKHYRVGASKKFDSATWLQMAQIRRFSSFFWLLDSLSAPSSFLQKRGAAEKRASKDLPFEWFALSRAQKIILTFYPRALPWAGMDCPFRASGQFLSSKMPHSRVVELPGNSIRQLGCKWLKSADFRLSSGSWILASGFAFPAQSYLL